MVEQGEFSYNVYTDKQAIHDATRYIKKHGWVGSFTDWFDSVEKGNVSKEITAMGWALYNNAANTAATTESKTKMRTMGFTFFLDQKSDDSATCLWDWYNRCF